MCTKVRTHIKESEPWTHEGGTVFIIQYRLAATATWVSVVLLLLVVVWSTPSRHIIAPDSWPVSAFAWFSDKNIPESRDIATTLHFYCAVPGSVNYWIALTSQLSSYTGSEQHLSLFSLGIWALKSKTFRLPDFILMASQELSGYVVTQFKVHFESCTGIHQRLDGSQTVIPFPIPDVLYCSLHFCIFKWSSKSS